MLGIGSIELIVLLLVAISALGMYLMQLSHWRWGVAIFGCTFVSAFITPADVYSMLVMAATLLCAYIAGSKHVRPRGELSSH